MPSFKQMLAAILLLAVCFATAATTKIPGIHRVNGKQFLVDTVISRDFTIVGGGAAGTYAAIRLQDMGYSVAVIEQTGRLGGHIQTYVDPNTGKTIDFGVRAWHKSPEVNNFFARLNVSLVSTDMVVSPAADAYFDLNTGKRNLTYTLPNPGAALGAYAAQVAKYPYLDNGFQVPLPYSLDAFMPTLWRSCQGVGNVLELPTLYVIKYVGGPLLEAFATGFQTTAANDNSALYESAARVLGHNVFYSATVLSGARAASGAEVVIKSNEKTILVESKKLIISMQPTLDNMLPFDLNSKEKSIFSQFKSSEYFVGILNNTGIPSNISVVNIDFTQPYGLPSPPNIFSIPQSGSENLQFVTYLSTTPTIDGEIQTDILSRVRNLEGRDTTLEPEFVVSSNHKPFELTVSAEVIKGGFYDDLYALQGERSTWYASATFVAHDSSLIWRFIEKLLPSIVA